MTPNVLWWAAGAFVLLTIGVVALVLLGVGPLHLDPFTGRLSRRRRRPQPVAQRLPDPQPTSPRAGIVVNPTKVSDLDGLQAQVGEVCRAHGWAAPIWSETTISDPGEGQARAAVEQGVDLVCSLGGDGTVRAVANGLVGTTTPLALLPGGTGNLLARNLGLPLDSIEKALVVALTGQDRRIDVGRVTIDRSGEDHRPEEHMFLVMAGIGFDAAVMADAPERLKKHVGPAAYLVSGVRNMKGPQFKIRLSVDDGPEVGRRTRTVLIGNCGRLFAGVALMPQARVDDGLLDTILLSPKGVVGWTAVAARVLSRRRHGHSIVDHHTGTRFAVRADRPEEVQVDGDIMGAARSVSARVDPGALLVRTAAR
ncbi:MAG: diacylglycerol/lipid kinase family protein [Dermatophilaceae bacterium]